MLAGRTYFAKMKFGDSIVNIFQAAGSHFDPDVVDALFAALETRPEAFDVGINGAELSSLASYRQKLKMKIITSHQMFI